MPRILYLHGLGGSPLGQKVAAMRAKFGHENVHAVEFPFSAERLRQLGQTVVFQNLKRIRAALRGMGAESERIAQEAYEVHQPEILVGSSLGGALAMQLAADKHLTCVLLTPVWNNQIKVDRLQQFLVRRMPKLQDYEHLIPLFGPFFLMWVRHFAGFRTSDYVQPRTLILHSPEDEVIDIRQSVELLANNPLPENGVDTAFMRSVVDTLVQQKYETDGRLVKIGHDHQMDSPDAITALVDAVSLLGSCISTQ